MKTIKLVTNIRILLSAFFIALFIYAQPNAYAQCTPNTSPTGSCSGLVINSSAGVLVNDFVISSPGGSYTVDVQSPNGAFSSFTNNGTIESSSTAAIAVNSAVGNIVNNGTISGSTGSGGIVVRSSGSVTTITNTGSIIPTSGNAIQNLAGGHIGSIINSGVISSGSTFGIGNAGTIDTITNTGRISGPVESIQNGGTIGVINNSNGSLFYNGRLPGTYNVIIYSPSDYGQMQVKSSSTGQMNFGIAAGSTATAKTYAGVLSGITAANLKNTTGTYQGLTWALALNGSLYDLSFTGTNTAVTAVNTITAQGLQTAFALQNTVLVNGFTYDCPLFDKSNVCVSVGGRYTAVDAQSVNSSAGVLIGAYRWNKQVRLGAYIDQNISTNTTGIIKVSNGSPMVGLFGVWNERLDGTGAEVRVSAGYGQKNTTMTRPVIDGTEPGSGSSTLTSQGAQAIAKYGFGVTDNTVVAPYAGLRYTQNNMNGYTEGTSAAVTAPLTYAPLNTNATTIVAGVGATYKIAPPVTLLASAGVESDTNTNYSSYSATGLYGLTSINMNPNPKYTRPTAMLGAYYDVEKNQRISLTGVYRQAPYQGVGATTYMALYTIGL